MGWWGKARKVEISSPRSSGATISYLLTQVAVAHCASATLLSESLFNQSAFYHNSEHQFAVLDYLSFSPSTAVDLSGRVAATSSIFLNCHGKREG